MDKKQTGSNISSLASQSHTNKQTGKAMKITASHVLQSSKYNHTTKSLAASILSQSNKKRSGAESLCIKGLI